MRTVSSTRLRTALRDESMRLPALITKNGRPQAILVNPGMLSKSSKAAAVIVSPHDFSAYFSQWIADLDTGEKSAVIAKWVSGHSVALVALQEESEEPPEPPKKPADVGLKCDKCKGPMRVIETRPSGEKIRRRRECEKCGHRMTTIEVPKELWESVYSGRIDAEKQEKLKEVAREILGI